MCILLSAEVHVHQFNSFAGISSCSPQNTVFVFHRCFSSSTTLLHRDMKELLNKTFIIFKSLQNKMKR